MRCAVILACLLLAACGRPLTPAEAAFATRLHGATLDTDRVRFVKGAPVGSVTYTRQKRPRLACRERILPEPQGRTVTVSPAAIVLHNKVFYDRDWYAEDYLDGYPERMDLVAAMLFAHEITHVWQWQNRDVTGYSPIRALREHTRADDPYLFDVDTQAAFLDYGYEQQAGIVEEYVCCATLDPDAPRTRRLADMLRGAFPLGRLPRPGAVRLPWAGAETEGICR
ncbi:hypothetical protein [Roseovarius salinarum]|uniref:hypothetical protein n=1 Tax=Roseovarius salinarum TaxID=1981892 RepID=UPI000C3202A8|nr:hypothetical protein [Roseovarius salinarum]